MSSSAPQSTDRPWILTAALPDENEQHAVDSALRESGGDWRRTLDTLRDTPLPETSLQRLTLAHTLAEWTHDHEPLVRAVLHGDPSVTTIDDVARHYGLQRLAELVDPSQLPPETPGASEAEKARTVAHQLRNALFTTAPTPVLQRMVIDGDIPIDNLDTRSGVARFLDNQPDFDIATTSVYTAMASRGAFDGIPADQQPAVRDQLKTLQTARGISGHTPDPIPHLIGAGLPSALSVTQLGESTFLRTLAPAIGEDTARQVYSNATSLHIRNEHALSTLRDTVRGSGLAVIDGTTTREDRVAAVQAAADHASVPLTLPELIGSIDQCACEDCQSIYSPAAYFVELLEFLRNNNLNAANANQGKVGIDGTPLQVLLRRRPDLACLELTCENAFTELPYIDLANEVMESFIVHLGDYHTDPHTPKQAVLDTFNVTDETTEELLAQPQRVNYQAYCTLKSTVYPATDLPYHQPIDTARIWLPSLQTSRFEVLDTFRTATEECASTTLTPAQLVELRSLHKEVQDRAVDAEYLGLTQEEYVILTHEAFWPKAYFDLTQKSDLSPAEYAQYIGVRPVHEYYGYAAEADMLSVDETRGIGLTFVHRQLLPRTGVHYADLVEIVKTRFINPAYPTGEALIVMESIQASYRFLQTLVDTTTTDPKLRYAKLIAYLTSHRSVASGVTTMLQANGCGGPTGSATKLTEAELTSWVECYFDRIGRLIVLDSNEGPRLTVAGDLHAGGDLTGIIGALRADGTMVGTHGALIGTVTADVQAVDANNQPFTTHYGDRISIQDSSGKTIGKVDREGFVYADPHGELLATWVPPRDTCNLSLVRLTHLDGTALTVDEYDRLHRFIRLWRRLSWTVPQTDQALAALSTPVPGGTPDGPSCGFVGLDAFQDDCTRIPTDGGGDGDGCPDIPPQPDQISAATIRGLTTISKLLTTTALPLDQLLCFWSDIPTSGERPLYARLFLTHNLIALDPVFQPDRHGNVLTGGAKLSEHQPVLLAALKLTAADVAAITTLRALPDALTLHTVSVIYRHTLLARLLHVAIPELARIIALFGDPFTDPATARDVLQVWQEAQDAGFTYRQLDYVIHGHDDPDRPVAPPQRTLLQLAKTLFDGLTAITHDHPDLPADGQDQASDERVRVESSLLFDAATVDKIVGLLDGTTVYTTYAPPNEAVTIPAGLADRLRYTTTATAPAAASLQVTGILTAADLATAQGLSPDPRWAAALDRLVKQPARFFADTLAGFFADPAAAAGILLAGDDNRSTAGAGTAPGKRLYFLQAYLPQLRRRLARTLIVDTVSAAAGLGAEPTTALLTQALTVDGRPALSVLEDLARAADTGSPGWRGYLIPPATGTYTFVATNGETRPAPLQLAGNPVAFTREETDPTHAWYTNPVDLRAGTLYWLDTGGLDLGALQWKTAITAPALIPASALLPDYSTQGTTDVFTKLFKAAIVVNGFRLAAEEITYLQTHPDDFGHFDWNTLTLKHWRRLHAYTALRDALPRSTKTLLDLFGWAAAHSIDTPAPDPAALHELIAAATRWDTASIATLLAADHFDLDRPDAFRNEINLVTLQRAITVADRTRASVDRLFRWADPGSRFWPTHRIAVDIQAALRARHTQSDWEQVVRPLYDQLREHQRQALVAYLLVQPDLIDWGVRDADSLFEFFLLDVQMSACLDTSRIQQAIATVQTFVQRCLLGLEAAVPAGTLDSTRWQWMQKYTTWAAGRQVFVDAENWLSEDLRNDATPFFDDLKAQLLQKDINPDTIDQVFGDYLSKFVDIANMQADGLYLDVQPPSGSTPSPATEKDQQASVLHIVARTRNTPHEFYYRYYVTNSTGRFWYPWLRLPVDIPSYDREKPGNAGQITVTENGSYVTPARPGHREVIFAPVFNRKTAPNPHNLTIHEPLNGHDRKKTLQELTNDPPDDHASLYYWEIKLFWSENRSARWTQKQLSTGAISDPSPGTQLPDIAEYDFVPREITSTTGGTTRHVVDVYDPTHAAIGRFEFLGTHLRAVADTPLPPFPVIAAGVESDFQWFGVPPPKEIGSQLYSLQAADAGAPTYFRQPPYFEEVTEGQPTFQDSPNPDATTPPAVKAYDRFAGALLAAFSSSGPDGLFQQYTAITSVEDKADAYGNLITDSTKPPAYHELGRPYSEYHWEIAFHAPMLLVTKLLAAGHFDLARRVCEYVLNPFAANTTEDPVWRFTPFRETDPAATAEQLLNSLAPHTPNRAITDWRNNPFDPHAVARNRPTAYMRWAALTYIRLWVEYGDYYFRQNTLETLPLALQCYVVASHLYGPAPESIPQRGTTRRETYNSLLDRWDAFGNAMVDLELLFPSSDQTPLPPGSTGAGVGLANIFGVASSLYFCIPANPRLAELRALIDDRLYKIRHCQDINGIPVHYPLFEPRIEPGLLVEAAAEGLSLATVLSDLNSPLPNYRFSFLLQKAFELCAEVKALGNAFLAAKEKGDAEQLAALRAHHDTVIGNLVLQVRTQQVDEATRALDALQESRRSAVSRMQHQLKLIGENLSKVPGADATFTELPDVIEAPVTDSGLKLSPYEKEETDKAGLARDTQIGAGVVEALASTLELIPDFHIAALPWGIGAATQFGGSNLGAVSAAVARSIQVATNELSFESSNAARKAGFQRQLQDRILQANVAGYEIANIDKQIATQQIRIAIANQEITNQQQQIDNATAVEDFLKAKYTNAQLYGWMDGQLKDLYHRAYTMAYDLAKKSEKLFQLERGLSESRYIRYGYWNPDYDGLLAGEQLYLDLKNLEAAHQQDLGYDFEITKPVSLRQIDPLALLQLRERGWCEFALPEVLFDMDYPGHYQRRIKSIAVTIPCVVGPYTSLNCTLRLLEHHFRNTPLVPNAADYPRQLGNDDRFTTMNVPVTAVAVSTGQKDRGRFELNFHDERLNPCEGAGAESRWRLDLPSDFRQFDYDTITDVTMEMLYTSKDGGEQLKTAARKNLATYLTTVEDRSRDEGLFAAFDLRNEFPDQWYKATHSHPATLTLENLYTWLPIYTRGHKPTQIQAVDIYLYTATTGAPTAVTLIQGGTTTSLTAAPGPTPTLTSFQATDQPGTPINTWQFTLDGDHLALEKLWLIVRYILLPGTDGQAITGPGPA